MKLESTRAKIFLFEVYGIRANTVSRLTTGVANLNFKVSTDEGSFLLKIYLQKKKSEAEFEVRLLDYLAKKGFPSPRVVRYRGDRALAVFEGKIVALFTFIPGAMLRSVDAKALFAIGRLLARLHLDLNGISIRGHRLNRDPESFKVLLRRDEKKIAKRSFSGVEDILNFLKYEYARTSIPKNLPEGITHQDVKPENIIVKSGQYSFIDFDNAYRGVLLYDFMTTVIWTCFDRGKLNNKKMSSLKRGYESVRKFSQREEQAMHVALRLRLLREILDWPRQFDSELARKQSLYFMKLYKNL